MKKNVVGFAMPFLLTIVLGGLMLIAVLPVHAAVSIVPECARAKSLEPASLDCAIQTFLSVARFIMGITGSLALLMFVYGGFTMLTANGVEDKVKSGKAIIRNAVIGIVLIVSAFYIIDYFSSSLRGGETHTVGEACLGGQGKYVSVGGTNLECRYDCMNVQGFACTSSPGNNVSCADYTCPSSQQKCCSTQ